MKTLLVLSCLALSSKMVLAQETTGEGPRNATDAKKIKILVETTNPANISLNGKTFERCVLYSQEGLTSFEGKKTIYIKIGVGKIGEELKSIGLFRIDENGEYVKRWYYPDSDQVSNQLSEKDLKYGYKFDSTPKKIYYTNGSSCMDQNSFEIKLKNGNLDEAVSVKYNEGMCNTAQFLLAVPSAIFGADSHGNDLKCKFTK